MEVIEIQIFYVNQLYLFGDIGILNSHLVGEEVSIGNIVEYFSHQYMGRFRNQVCLANSVITFH